MDPSIFQETFDITKNLKQNNAFLSNKRLVLVCSGIQGGKSLVGALKLRKAIVEDYPLHKYPNVNFAVCAPEYKTMHQSTRRAFDLVFQDMGKVSEMAQEFNLPGGRKIYFRTMIKNLNAVEGIPNCVFIWADECAQYPRTAYLNMQSRTAFMKGQLFMTTTPYAFSWPKKEIIDKWKAGDPDIDYYEWLSIENPAFPKDEYERQKKMMSQKEFERKYMGKHTRMEGLVFEDFNELNWIDNPPLDKMTMYGGCDWGFDHPLGLSIRGVYEGKSYGISFFKESGLSVMQQLELIKAKTKVWHVKHWSCGADRPEMIMELNKMKIPAFKYFEHSPNYREVNSGNAKHAELIKTKDYKVWKSAEAREDLVDEYETYAWDKKEDEEQSKERPKDVNDDLMSAERYATIGTLHLLTSPKIKLTVPLGYYQKRDLWKPTDKEKDWDSY